MKLCREYCQDEAGPAPAQQSATSRVHQFIAEYAELSGQMPSDREIAKGLGVPVEEVRSETQKLRRRS
jgi:DNA-directed RNA polymerase specialized sigma subunit